MSVRKIINWVILFCYLNLFSFMPWTGFVFLFFFHLRQHWVRLATLRCVTVRACERVVIDGLLAFHLHCMCTIKCVSVYFSICTFDCFSFHFMQAARCHGNYDICETVWFYPSFSKKKRPFTVSGPWFVFECSKRVGSFNNVVSSHSWL